MIIISTVSARQSPMELPKKNVHPISTAFFGPRRSMSVPATMTMDTSAMMYPERSQLVRSEPVSDIMMNWGKRMYIQLRLLMSMHKPNAVTAISLSLLSIGW